MIIVFRHFRLVYTATATEWVFFFFTKMAYVIFNETVHMETINNGNSSNVVIKWGQQPFATAMTMTLNIEMFTIHLIF